MPDRGRSHSRRSVVVALALACVVLACSLPLMVGSTPSPSATMWQPTAGPTRTAWLPSATPFPPCPGPLDDSTLGSLVLYLDPSLQMQAGDTETLSLGVVENWPLVRPIDAYVAWSVEPQEGVSITQDGELAIDPSVSHGSVFTVTAHIENGRRLISLSVYIYDLSQDPLIGGWREKSQITCGSREEVPPSEPILSLVFYADGRMTVTWHPIETYIDYAATYAASKDGNIELTMSTFYSPFAPGDFDGLGTYSIDPAGDLMLREVWLGSPEGATAIANCGHRFVRP